MVNVKFCSLVPFITLEVPQEYVYTTLMYILFVEILFLFEFLMLTYRRYLVWQMWPDLIKKAKEGGLDAIETYVFWNAHEPLRRQYDFTGNLDLIRFIKTIQDQGLYVILRIGPYVCAEWNYGWVHFSNNS